MSWQRQTGIEFMTLPFGISLDRFVKLETDENMILLSGSLHSEHSPVRSMIKSELFKSKFINLKSNMIFGGSLYPIKSEFQKYKIYWAEWEAEALQEKNYYLLKMITSNF